MCELGKKVLVLDSNKNTESLLKPDKNGYFKLALDKESDHADVSTNFARKSSAEA